MFGRRNASLSPTPGRLFLYTVVTAAAYFFSAKLMAPLALGESSSIFAVWPPTGVALSFLLFRGYMVLPGVFLGAFALNMTLSSLSVAFEIAIGNTLGPAVAYGLIMRKGSGGALFDDIATVVRFIFFTALGAFITSAMGSTVLHLNGLLATEHWLLGWLIWFFGDLIGFMLIAPVVAAWKISFRLESEQKHNCLEIVLLLALLFCSGILIFGSGYFFDERYPVEYLILFPLIWASIRFRPGVNLLFLIVVTVMAILGTSSGYSQFAYEGEHLLSLVFLQFFIFTVTFAILLMTAQRCQSLRALYEKERLTLTDPLTGVGNRRFFSERFVQELSQSRRYRHPLTVVMFDIDHFKLINDRYGHQSGDTVLKELSALSMGKLRLSDNFARWGGEEFVILLPETSLQEGLETAQKLRAAIETHPLGIPEAVTCSFGVAECGPEETLESVMARVDSKLYEAKEGGRNRVVG